MRDTATTSDPAFSTRASQTCSTSQLSVYFSWSSIVVSCLFRTEMWTVQTADVRFVRVFHKRVFHKFTKSFPFNRVLCSRVIFLIPYCAWFDFGVSVFPTDLLRLTNIPRILDIHEIHEIPRYIPRYSDVPVVLHTCHHIMCLSISMCSLRSPTSVDIVLVLSVALPQFPIHNSLP